MNVNDYMKIHVKIDGMKYPMTVLRKEEYPYRQSAKIVNEKINLYRLRYKDASSIQHWSMVAFEMAFTVISEREKDVLKKCRERIEHLEKELDKYMNNREIKNG